MNTDRDILKAQVLNILSEDYYVKGAEIAASLGYKDTRTIRLAINALIDEDNQVIISNSHGYKIAASPEEATPSLAILHSYLVSTGYHHKILLKAIRRRWPEQKLTPPPVQPDPYQIPMLV